MPPTRSRRIRGKGKANDCLAPSPRRARLELLEKRLLLTSNTNPFSTYANSLQSEVAQIQSTIDGAFSAASSLKSLPFIGQQLGAIDQAQGAIDAAGNKIQSALQQVSTASPKSSDLQNALFSALGPSGANLLADTNNDGSINSQDIVVTDFATDNGVLKTANVEVRLHEGLAAVAGPSLTFNLGLPALPFHIVTTGGITVMVGFDYELAIDYNSTSSTPITLDASKKLNDFNSSLSADQLVVSVSAGLTGSASLTADVGILRGTLVPTQGQTNSLSAQVKVDNLNLQGAPSVSFGGSAQINLTATLGLGDANDSQAFPSITTDFSLNWTDLTNPSSLALSYGNVQLNLGQFISGLVEPVVADIQQYTKPFQGAIDDLNTPIPGIDKIIPGFSVMTLAGGIANYTGYGAIEGVVADALQIANIINGINVSSLDSVSMPMGDFNLDGQMIAAAPAALDPTVLSNLADSLSSLNFSDLTGSAQSIIDAFASNITNIISGLGLGSGVTSFLDTLASAATGANGASANIDFPLFDNPKSILNLLFGRDVDLVAFNANFNLSLPASSEPPGASYLGVDVGVQSSLTADGSLKVGYDTYGLRELLNNLETGTPTASTIAGDIANGFYIQGPQGSNPGSQVTVSGKLGLFAGAGVSFFGIASASLGLFGGLQGTVSISLNDQFPDSAHDGRIRYQELGSEITSGQVFNASGDVTAGLSVVVSANINYGLGSISLSDTLLTIASTTLYDSSSASNSSLIPTTPPPIVAGVVDSDSGPVGGGTSVIICGTNLNGASVVDFGLNAATIVSDSADEIVATAPAGTAGTVDVSVTTPGGTSQLSPNDQYAYVPVPTISAVSPTAGRTSGGISVTITGTNLGGVANQVDFGSTGAWIQSDTATQIVVTEPSGSGSVPLTVTTPGGTATAPAFFTFQLPPVITSIGTGSAGTGPASGPLMGGTLLTIKGTNLEFATQVDFPGRGLGPSRFLTDTSTEIQVLTPNENAGTGTVDVRVEADGTISALTTADQFTYAPAPIVSSLSPGAGPLTGGGSVAITGTNLGSATAVDFGQNAGTIVVDLQPDPVNNPALWVLVATAPAGAAGLVDVTVTTPGGTSALAPPDDQFLYTPVPIVVAVGVPEGGHLAAASGPLAGGTEVEIEGYVLGLATAVDFGGVAGTIVAKNGSGLILAKSPAASMAGTVDVTVVTPGGTTATSAADKFTYTPAPIVSGVSVSGASRAQGSYQGGTTVAITGQDLAGATKVDFGPNSGVIDSDTGDVIEATSPVGAVGPADVTVTTAGGTSATSLEDQFTYVVLPNVTGVTPSTGPAMGGTIVTITGTDLQGATAVNFNFGDTYGTIQSDTATQIVVLSPTELVGTVDVIVTTPNGQSAVSPADRFTFTSALEPTISNLSSSSGPTGGGTTVIITGTNLVGATAVDFGNVAATSFLVNPDGAIDASSPPGSAGTVDVTVTTPNGSTPISSADKFTYQVPGPVVSMLSQNSGATGGGTSVTITGTNLSDATAVDFGNTPATSFTDNANGSITATSPQGTAGATVDVIVVTAGGTSAATQYDKFTYGAAPSIYDVFFNAGEAGAGDMLVFIFGTNLQGATSVNFGPYVNSYDTGVGQIDNISPDGTELSAIVPGEPAGTVNVTITTPNGTSPINPGDEYTNVAGPLLQLVAPTVGTFPGGPAAGGTSVNLAGYDLSDATAVSFGGVSTTNFTVNSNRSLTVISPPSAPGTVDVTVTTPEGTSPTGFSLDNDAFTYLAAPSVSGVSPASGPVAGGNTVEIFGTDLGDETEVDFGGVAGTLTGDTGDYLYATAPAGTLGTVDITVTTLGGTSPTSSADHYTYLPPPVVSALSPASPSGALEGGTQVTITGSNLSGATEVDFGPNAGTIVSDTNTQIVAVSPAGSGTGTVDVTVTTPTGGTSATSSADQFTYTHAPFIASLSQSTGPVAGGTTVDITGDDLDNATAVDFGQTVATIVSDGPNLLEVTTPSEIAGTVNVTVTTPNGTTDISPADQFGYFAVPSVSAVSPSTGSISNGTQVLITGTALAGATAVDFGGVAGTIISDTDNQILVNSPYDNVGGVSLGTVDVTVVTPGGTSTTSAADQFTYMQSPYVNTVTPDSGSVYGGSYVTISGTALTAADSVLFGANAGTILSNTGSQILAISPEATGDATGPVDVTVVTQYGTSPTSGSDQFTYVVPPAVTGLSQTAGPAAGGTTVTISGENLSGATAVDFGGVAELHFFVNFDGATVTVVSPTGAVGAVDVTVTTPGGTSSTSSADQFTYLAAPIVSAISPGSGPVAGGTQVTITGTNLTGATEVDFNDGQGDDYVGTILSDTDGQILVTSPFWGYPATVDVTVTTAGGTSATSPADQFSFVAAPAVSGIGPTSGSTSGGDTVTITGTNLAGATAVDFGQNAGTIVSDTASQIQAVSPPGTAGSINVTVTTPGGTSSTSSLDHFTYVAPAPAVTGLSTSVGSAAGGTTVTITGADLENASEVDFGGSAGTIVSDTATQLVVTSPAGIVGTVDVTVTTPSGTSDVSAADQFTYFAPPAVTAVDSPLGPVAGGSTEYIYGSDLAGATGVDFGPTAGSIVFDGDSYLIANTPAGAAGTVDVTVTTPYGTSTTSSLDQFVYVAAPAVTSVTSADGPVGPIGGGTLVTIDGANFAGATDVYFGSTEAAIQSLSDNQITAYSPSAAVGGPVDVTVVTAGGVSATSPADQFTYLYGSDTALPTSAVAVLPTVETSTLFSVSWSGQDSGGSGIASFNVFVSENGGAYAQFQFDTTQTTALFQGADGHSYNFYSLATDADGNVQTTPTVPQATTVVQASLQITNNADSGPGSLRQVLLDAATAPGQTHTITFALPAGSQTINLLTPLPGMSDPLILAADGTQQVTIACSSATAWNVFGPVTKTGAGSVVLQQASSFSGAIDIEGGSLVFNDPTAPLGSARVAATLSSLAIANNGAPLGSTVYDGTFDIGNDGLVIDYGNGPDPYAQIEDMVRAGYDGGKWDGTGIIISLAASTPGLNVAVFDNAALGSLAFGASNPFEGQAVASHTVLVRLTYMDDLTGVGQVTQNDAIIFGSNYDNGAASGHAWAQGDLNHDGKIDQNDAILFGSYYNPSLAPMIASSTAAQSNNLAAAINNAAPSAIQNLNSEIQNPPTPAASGGANASDETNESSATAAQSQESGGTPLLLSSRVGMVRDSDLAMVLGEAKPNTIQNLKSQIQIPPSPAASLRPSSDQDGGANGRLAALHVAMIHPASSRKAARPQSIAAAAVDAVFDEIGKSVHTAKVSVSERRAALRGRY